MYSLFSILYNIFNNNLYYRIIGLSLIIVIFLGIIKIQKINIIVISDISISLLVWYYQVQYYIFIISINAIVIFLMYMNNGDMI